MTDQVAIYARVSTDMQELDNQLSQLREYAKKSGYDVFEEYVEKVSGAEEQRPEFNRLFVHAHQKRFEAVLFWDLSRFSRSGTLYTLQKLRELDNLGITWLSYREPYFRSAGPFSDVVISIMATLAKIEREKISERTKAGLRGKKNVGKRGKDKKSRKARSDRGLKRGVRKK